MKPEASFVCPRCDFALIPVHAVEQGKRRIIAMTCPEPYCDHMQMLPPRKAREIEKAFQERRRQAALRQAN